MGLEEDDDEYTGHDEEDGRRRKRRRAGASFVANIEDRGERVEGGLWGGVRGAG